MGNIEYPESQRQASRTTEVESYLFLILFYVSIYFILFSSFL